jgi:hypothetical protein
MPLIYWLGAAIAWYLAAKNHGDDRWFFTIVAIATMAEGVAINFQNILIKVKQAELNKK